MSSNDLRLQITESGVDLVLEGGDIAGSSGLEELVLTSLFSDARASDDELAARGDVDPRGWWAESPGDSYGSKLWLLDRAKLTPANLRALADHCRSALAWMRSEGIVESVDVSATITGGRTGWVQIDVTLRRGALRTYAHLWEGLQSGATSFATVGDARVRLLIA